MFFIHDEVPYIHKEREREKIYEQSLAIVG